jgi:hypothetical protein
MLRDAKYKVYHSSEIPPLEEEPPKPTPKTQPKHETKKPAKLDLLLGYILHELGKLLG